jgi:hypothetical protein
MRAGVNGYASAGTYAAAMTAFTSMSFKSLEKEPSGSAFTALPKISFQAATAKNRHSMHCILKWTICQIFSGLA